MNNYKNIIIFLFYAIEKEIIQADEISEWSDNQILNDSTLPYFLTDLSLAKSLNEQFGILDDVIHRNSVDFRNISFKCILSQIQKIYFTKEENILNIIRKIISDKR